jgi:hypothetical protein
MCQVLQAPALLNVMFDMLRIWMLSIHHETLSQLSTGKIADFLSGCV